MSSLVVIADELDAIARRLGATRFPGVGESIFDAVPASCHVVLCEHLLAGLAARGVLDERDGRIIAAPSFAALLAPTLRGTVRYEIERIEPAGTSVTALGAADGAVVRHRAEGLYHRFDLVGTDGDVAGALAALLTLAPGTAGAADGTGRSGLDRSPFRRRRSALVSAAQSPEAVPPAFAALADHWRATTTIYQLGCLDGAPAASWITIVDGGPSCSWLLVLDPDSTDDGLTDADDPLFLVTPIDATTLHRHLQLWCG